VSCELGPIRVEAAAGFGEVGVFFGEAEAEQVVAAVVAFLSLC